MSEAALEAIVLAGGAGTRFGGRKLLAPWGLGTVLEACLATVSAAPVRRIVLVTGADTEAVEAEARRVAADRMHLVHAADWAEGMAASLRTAAAALSPDASGAFVFLGDMPRVPAPVLQPLAIALASGAPAAVPVWRGRRGHPALLGRALLPKIAGLRGDQGARRLLEALGHALATVEAPDDGVLFDVDTRGDLAG